MRQFMMGVFTGLVLTAGVAFSGDITDNFYQQRQDWKAFESNQIQRERNNILRQQQQQQQFNSFVNPC